MAIKVADEENSLTIGPSGIMTRLGPAKVQNGRKIEPESPLQAGVVETREPGRARGGRKTVVSKKNICLFTRRLGGGVWEKPPPL